MTQTTREALIALVYAVSQQDPFNEKGGCEFEGRYMGADERGSILLNRAMKKAKEVLEKGEIMTTVTTPLDVTQKEYDELYPAWQMMQGSPLNGCASFREFVLNDRNQKAFQQASMLPPDIRIVP
jgi:hypothetical protein